MRVELIYDADCPNVAETRANLSRAFAVARLKPEWTEWERSSPLSPPHVKRFGSPTVLVEGRDVAGEAARDDGSSCRLYVSADGRYSVAPGVELIQAALSTTAPSAGSVQTGGRFGPTMLSVPGIVVSALPFGGCPACWPIYAGVLSTLGLGFLLSGQYLLPLTALCLFVTIFALGFRARARRGYGPFFLGLIATALILFGKFAEQSNALAYGGMGLLIVGSVWNSWPRRAGQCPQCATSADLIQLSAREKS